MWRLQHGTTQCKRHNEVEAFNNLLQVMDLNDCWREMNNQTKAFTWSRKELFVTRRLDYIFCGEELMPYVKKQKLKHFLQQTTVEPLLKFLIFSQEGHPDGSLVLHT